MKQFEVGVTPPYPVTVGVGLFPQLGELLNGRDVAVIADANVSRLFGEQLLDCLGAPEAGGQTSQARRELFEIPSGEGSKSVKVYGELLEKLAVAGFGRDAAVVALGGGVTTDLAGFVAATYMRGVDFYSFPTSLLAMVDASLGGKTGINLTAGKNLAGAFWQPRAVLVDVAVLRTLPDHLFRDGAVELFKHGLLACPPLLGALDDPEFTPAGEPDRLATYLERSIEVKARIVVGDEREAGARAHLNLGHTLAHALEAATGHGLTHGQAVAYGLLYAGLLSRNRGMWDFTGEALRLLAYLSPSGLPELEFTGLLEFMTRDKKVAGGRLRFVLMRAPQEPVVVADISRHELESAWRELLEVAK